MDVKKTKDGELLEQRLKELSQLTVRVGYQRGEESYDAEEIEKYHAAQRKKRKKGKGTSAESIEPVRVTESGAAHKPGASRKDAKVDMLDVVMWNELGTVHSPSRPFLRMSVDENEAKISKFVSKVFRWFINLKIDCEQLLNLLGNFQKGLVQRTIREGKFVPNAPATIKIKGSDKPLIDTGRMRQSIHYQVMTKDDAKAFDSESLE